MTRSASPALVAQLVAALEQADLYVNSYDVSKPSRIKTETRLALEEALGAVKRELLGPGADPDQFTASDAVAEALEANYVRALLGDRTLAEAIADANRGPNA